MVWERALIGAHRLDDRGALDALYRAYAGALYARVLVPLLREPALAEDALADTFTRAQTALHTFRAHDRSLYFWLARTAKNVAIDILRRADVRRRAAPWLAQQSERLDLPEPDPETALSLRHESEVLERRVAATLAKLPARHRRAIELRFFEERSREDCALALQIKLATFDVLLLRALRGFRKSWSEVPP